MKIYHWDRDTKLFTRATDAPLDEVKTKVLGAPAYRVPACATTKEPPEVGNGIVCYFDEAFDDWLTALDYRGITLYSTKTGAAVTTSHVGALPKELTELPPIADVPCKWSGSEWVIDEVAIADRDNAERLTDIRSRDIFLFKLILAMFKVGREKGIWSVSDFPVELVLEAQDVSDIINSLS